MAMSDASGAQRLTGEANSLGEAAAQARRELEAEGGSVSEGGGDPFALVMAEFSEGATMEVACRRTSPPPTRRTPTSSSTWRAREEEGAGLARATTLHEFVEAFRAAVPKPKPPPKLRRAGSVVSTKEGGSPASARPDT